MKRYASIRESRDYGKMAGDAKGGPFLNYYMYDAALNRHIFMEGFIYNPGEKKRKDMRMLEAIMRELQLEFKA